jgi:acid phosphatase type 7
VTARRFAGIAGVILPFSLVVYIFRLHGMPDVLRDYLPLQHDLDYLLTAGILTLGALLLDGAWRGRQGRAPALTKRFLWVMSVAAILLTLSFAAYIWVPKFTGGGDFPPQLIMIDPPATQKTPCLAVTFYTARATKNTVLWGEVDGKLKHVAETSAANKHWFRLDGLKPGTDYMYTLNDDPAVFFRTPPAPGQTIWFAAAGDAHVGNKTSSPAATERMLAAIARPTNGYSMFFSLGDLAQLGFNRSIWQQAGETFSPYTRMIPTAFVPGNHDMMLGGDDLYRRYLLPPDAGGAPPLTQRVDVGSVHFLLLDLEWELAAYSPAERVWLETQLKAIPRGDWTIVMCHTFFYCSGAVEDGWPWYDNKTVINELSPLFEKYGVNLVISGHKHQAEVLEHNGVTYVIAGTMGGQPDKLLTYRSPASKWLKQGVFGYADVTINGSTATVAFRSDQDKVLYRTTIKR